jgi:hypothetical protein
LSVAFVVGNGKSREPINLKEIKPFGKVYACNAVYRSFRPHYLIAVDVKMILEITQHRWQLDNEVWTNPNRTFNSIPNLKLFNPSKGWSSGPTALWMASHMHGYDEIYILGFDYRGAKDKNGEYKRVNNMFADTQNYKKSHDPATYFGNWERQTLTTIKSHPETRYIRVVEEGETFLPNSLKDLPNLSQQTVSEFKKFWQIS